MSEQHHPDYKKIYIALVILLAISVAGPHVGLKWLTLITAFGVALVKANLVVENFMHLKWEKVLAKWVLGTSLVLMALFFAGVSPDVMEHKGDRWVNNAAIAAVARGIPDEEEAAAQEPGAEEAAAPREAAAAAPPAPAFKAEEQFKQVCSACHGLEGKGNGPGAASLDPKPANFTDPAFWADKDDATLVKAIREGGASVGKSSAMPAWGSLYNEDQAKQIVAYLHTLKGN
ncbi:MAG: c-type cytochrome [Gemmatimonadetes bacterium]|nr:c-type cytochrome [Gemmatimonadota bacterium]